MVPRWRAVAIRTPATPNAFSSSSCSGLEIPPPTSRLRLGCLVRTSFTRAQSTPPPLPTRARSSRMTSFHPADCRCSSASRGVRAANAGQFDRIFPARRSRLNTTRSGPVLGGDFPQCGQPVQCLCSDYCFANAKPKPCLDVFEARKSCIEHNIHFFTLGQGCDLIAMVCSPGTLDCIQIGDRISFSPMLSWKALASVIGSGLLQSTLSTGL